MDEIDALFEGLEPITPDLEEAAASAGNAVVDPIIMPRDELAATHDLFPAIDLQLLVRRAVKGEERLNTEERQLARKQIEQVNEAVQRLAAVTSRVHILPACWPEHLEGIWAVELLSQLVMMNDIKINTTSSARNTVEWFDKLAAELRASCSTKHVMPESVPIPSTSPYPTARID